MTAKPSQVAIVVSDYHRNYTDKLLAGARRGVRAVLDRQTESPDTVAGTATDIRVLRAPGAFELPLLAKITAARSEIDAVICLGCIIRSDTPHFDFVAGECARGIMQAGLDTGVPVIFGVLTLENEAQAIERTKGDDSNRGFEAGMAAGAMVLTIRSQQEGSTGNLQ